MNAVLRECRLLGIDTEKILKSNPGPATKREMLKLTLERLVVVKQLEISKAEVEKLQDRLAEVKQTLKETKAELKLMKEKAPKYDAAKTFPAAENAADESVSNDNLPATSAPVDQQFSSDTRGQEKVLDWLSQDQSSRSDADSHSLNDADGSSVATMDEGHSEHTETTCMEPSSARKTQSEFAGPSFKASQCTICSRIFSQKHYLKEHMIRRHSYGIGSRFECSNCPKLFVTKSELKVHYLSAHERRMFNCKHCSKNFRSACACKKHELRHGRDRNENVKPQCPFCDKMYASYKTLLTHVRKSHPE